MISRSTKSILDILKTPRKLVSRAKDETPTKKPLAFRSAPLKPYQSSVTMRYGLEKPYVVKDAARKAENDLGRLISELS